MGKLRYLEVLASLVLSSDHDNVERAPLTSADLSDRATNRSTKGELWPPAVDKEGLSNRDFVADIDLEGWTQAGTITADKRSSAHRLIVPDVATRLHCRNDIVAPYYFYSHRNVVRLCLQLFRWCFQADGVRLKADEGLFDSWPLGSMIFEG